MLVDTEPSALDAGKAALVLRGDAGATSAALLGALRAAAGADAPLLPGAAAWAEALGAKVAAARERLGAKLARTAFPLDYHTTLRVGGLACLLVCLPACLASQVPPGTAQRCLRPAALHPSLNS